MPNLRPALGYASLLLCAAAHAADDGARARLRAELGAVYAPLRAERPLDPAQALTGQQRAAAALNLKAGATAGRVRLVLDAWAEASRDEAAPRSARDRTRGELPEAWLEVGSHGGTAAAAGVAIARWGTGYSWNPASPVLDPEANNTSRARAYRRDGDPFVRLETVFGRDSAGVYLTELRQNDPLLDPLRGRERVGYGRWQHVLDAGDLTAFLAAGERGERFGGLALSWTVGDALELHAEAGVRNRRRAARPQLVAVPVGADTLALPQWDEEPEREAAGGVLLGGQYTFANRTNVIVEYAWQGNGLSRTEFGTLRAAIDAARALDGTPLQEAGRGFLLDTARRVGRLRRNYLFVRAAADEIAPDLALHYYMRLGIDDGAAVHGLFLQRAFSQRVRLLLSAEIYPGPQRAETRLIPTRGRAEATLSVDF